MNFRIKFVILTTLFFGQLSMAADTPTTVKEESNYKGWGWTALVMRNGLITTATVPSIGARVMQYDLADHSQIYINPEELRKTYTPASNSSWHNFGGYKVWPAPQSVWNWPPPPTLDFGKYSAQIKANTEDSVSIFVASPVEKWLAPNLCNERLLTIYKGTTRVRVEQTIVNQGTKKVNWSVWDITQCIVNHPGKTDFANFRVYFPINPKSVFGKSGVKTSASSSAWKGEVAPGVYGVQFLPEGKKIFADSHQGWVAYLDEKDGYAYIKTFPIYPGEKYPDDGARVEVYIGNSPYYLEVEVLNPVREIKANGGKNTFVEDWWATKINGPILFANNVGAIQKRLKYSEKELTGTYGVFYIGTAQIVILDEKLKIIAQGKNHEITPLATFNLKESLDIPGNANTVELRVKDAQGKLVGTLDSANAAGWSGVESRDSESLLDFQLQPNFPNPFNSATQIEYTLPASGEVELKVMNLQGQTIRQLVNQNKAAGVHQVVWNGTDESGESVSSGIYLYQLKIQFHGKIITRTGRMLFLK